MDRRMSAVDRGRTLYRHRFALSPRQRRGDGGGRIDVVFVVFFESRGQRCQWGGEAGGGGEDNDDDDDDDSGKGHHIIVDAGEEDDRVTDGRRGKCVFVFVAVIDSASLSAVAGAPQRSKRGVRQCEAHSLRCPPPPLFDSLNIR